MQREEVKQWIRDNLFNRANQLQITPAKYKILEKNYFKFVEIIENNINCDGISFSKKCYLFLEDYTQLPTCKKCGKIIKNFSRNNSDHKIKFASYCSRECSSKDCQAYKTKKTFSKNDLDKILLSDKITSPYIMHNTLNEIMPFLKKETNITIHEKIYLYKNNIQENEYKEIKKFFVFNYKSKPKKYVKNKYYKNKILENKNIIIQQNKERNILLKELKDDIIARYKLKIKNYAIKKREIIHKKITEEKRKAKEVSYISINKSKDENLKIIMKRKIFNKREMDVIRKLFDPNYIVKDNKILCYCIKNNIDLSIRWNYIHPSEIGEDYSMLSKQDIYDLLINHFCKTSNPNKILSKHNLINLLNKSKQDIYDYLKGPKKCIYCGNTARFRNIKYGYEKSCFSKECKSRSKSIMSKNREEIFRTTIMEDGRTLKSHISDKSRFAHSLKMKKLIKEGKFTPCVTNSRCNSRVYVNNIPLRSTWEGYFYLCNLHLSYEATRIKYIYEDKERIYITDFTDFEKKIIYEIKPDSERQNNQVLAKEKYAKNWCKDNNFIFKYISNEWFFKNYNPQLIIDSNLISEEIKIKMLKALKQFII